MRDVSRDEREGPYLVQKAEPARGRNALWGAAVGALVLLLIAGVIHHRVARSESRPPAAGAGAAVPAAKAALGAVRATVRISGTLAAMRSVALLAPRIQGSRS